MDLKDWLGLAIIGFMVLCGLFALSQLSKPYNVSTEEFERRAQEGPGLLGKSLIGLQAALDPSKQRAVEVLEDLKQGRYDGEQESGDPPEAGSATNEDENSQQEKPNA
jgi:hypothetical protein